MRNLFFVILILISSNAYATKQVVEYTTHGPVVVCQPSDTNTNCGGGGASGWTKSGTNVVLTTSTDNVGIGSVNPVDKLDVLSSVSSIPAIRASGPTNGGDYSLLVSSSIGGQSNMRMSSAFDGSGYGFLISGEPTQGTLQFYCSEAVDPGCANANYQRIQFFGNPIDFMIAPTDFFSRQSAFNISSKGNSGLGVQPDNAKLAVQGIFQEPGTISDDGSGNITCDSSNCGFSSRLGFGGGESLYINGNLYQIDFVNDDNSLTLTSPSDASGSSYYYVPTYIASFLTYLGDPALIVSANGYVGVGTYPSYNLDVAGDARVTSAASDSTTYNSFATFPTTAARNDATLDLGYTFTPTVNITVSQLGRLYVAGNSNNHTIYIYNAGTQALVTSGTVLAASSSDGNSFKYVAITPVTLNAGTVYAIVCQETASGDTWRDIWSSTNSYTRFIKRTGYAYGSHAVYPTTQSGGTDIYNTPAMKFTAELSPQETVAYDSSNNLRIYSRSGGNTSIIANNPDKFVGFSGLAVGKTQGTAGQALDVAGPTTITSSYPGVIFTDGTAPLTMGASTTGASGNSMRWYTASFVINAISGGTMYFNLDTTGNEYHANNVGIGGQPGQMLDVVTGNSRIRGTGNMIFGDDNKAFIQASATTAPDIKFNTNSAEIMRITNGGNVGIGSTAPGQKLDVQGTVRSLGFTQTGASADTFTGTPTFSNATFSGLFTGGNVGIGSATPGKQLDVQGTIRTINLVTSGNVSISTTSATTNLTVLGTDMFTYSGGDSPSPNNTPFLIDVSGSSLSNGPAFKVNLPGSGLQKAFQFANSTDTTAWASFEYNTGGTGLAGLALGPGSSTARDVKLYRAAATVLRTDSSMVVDGNMGIGSTAPGQKLDVQGTVRISALGSTLAIASGTNGCQGQATLSSGIVTVSTACTPSTSQGIFLTDAQTSLLNVGSVTVATVTNGSSFVIQSTNVADASKVNWTIIKSN